MEHVYEPPRASSKTILILKAHHFSLKAAEVFLHNRGWKIFSTTDVKEALLKLVEEKFTYVLLSVDHPNKKTPILPQLIAHKFPATVMTFAEDSSAKSYNALTSSEASYKVYAPVTGPAIERCITKYLRDQQTRSLLTTKPLANPITARHRLPAFYEDKSHGHVTYPQPLADQGKSSGIFVARQKRPVDFGSVQATSTKTGELGSLKYKNNDNEYQQRHFSQKRKRSDALDTLIARGTQKSLNGTVNILDGYVLHKVENTTNSGCILVESERFSGYIVTAIGKDRKLEDAFLLNIKKMLFKYLKDNGEHLTESEIMTIKLKQVNFEPWALEYADFLRKSVHQGDEVAVAFFPRRPANLSLENSHHRDMAKIRLQDLRGDRQVEFNLFIHLIANDKYVLYTPKGGIFYQKQLDRLKHQGITHLHVPKNAADSVTKYYAQNYLNELVEAFDESVFVPEKTT